MENPLQWLLRINQEKGGAVLDALGNIPNVIQEIPGRIQQGADNLLKIGQDSLDQVVEAAVEQQEQRKTNLETGGWTGFKQEMTDNAGLMMEAATPGGWLDVAGMGLMEVSGADWVPQNLKLPLLVGGLAVSAADGTPSPLSPKQLNRLSRVSSTAREAYGKRPHDTALSNVITPSHVDPKSRIFGRYRTVDGVKSAIRHPGAHANIDTPIFHHIVGKKVRWRFQQKMETFDPKGKNRLETIDNKYNLESGSGEKAGYPMDEVAHKIHHFESRLEGIEPFDTKGNKTLSKLKKLIDNAESPEELEELYELYITASVLPDFDHAIKFQRGYEILGSRPDVLREELIKVSNEWGNRMKDIESVKADIRMEDLHQAAIDLVESTKKFRN